MNFIDYNGIVYSYCHFWEGSGNIEKLKKKGLKLCNLKILNWVEVSIDYMHLNSSKPIVLIFLLLALINIQIFVRRCVTWKSNPSNYLHSHQLLFSPHLFYERQKAEDICWLGIYIDCPQCIIVIVLPYKYTGWITVRDYYSIWKVFCSFLQLHL